MTDFLFIPFCETKKQSLPCQRENPAHPAHAPDMHEDEDEDDKPLVRPASRKKLAEKRRDRATDDEDIRPLVPP